MPIIHKQGDLLASDCEIIAHGANCFHTMGAGIARQIRRRFPEAYEADKRTAWGSISKLGTCSYGRGSKHVFNLYTQYNTGRAFELKALIRALADMKRVVDHIDPDSKLKIGFPRIGCGIGGGRWSEVEPMISLTFPDRDVYVYTFKPN